MPLYDKLFGNAMALNRYLRIRNIHPEIKDVKNSRVLDIGCLDGHFTSYFIGRGNRVFAIDIKNHGISRLSPPIIFCIGKGEYLPFSDNTFDLVFCSDVFEHVERFENIVPEIYRVIKPGKLCLVSTVDGYWKSPLEVRSFLLKYLPKAWAKSLMGKFAVSNEALHINYLGHVRYDINIDNIEDIFSRSKLALIRKRQYCFAIGSFLMEIFFSFNEKIRFVLFPLLKLLLPLDAWLTFGKPWQYYIVFEKR
jgi:ubiquinone/menaquinone biosynthesis C-methylase UbiE